VVVVFYISGHGFGHASRQIEVMHALRAERPDTRLVVRSATARGLFDTTAPPDIDLQPVDADTGLVQIDSLRMDEDATVRAASRFYAGFEARADDEAAFLRRTRPDVVVGDIPPLAFAAADRAGVPAVAVSNFTWDWIYEDYPSVARDAPHVIPAIRRAYATAGLTLRLPFHGGFDAMAAVQDVPLVARRSRRDPADTRRALGVDGSRPLVLVSFGGYRLALPLDDLRRSGQFAIVAPEREAPPRPALRRSRRRRRRRRQQARLRHRVRVHRQRHGAALHVARALRRVRRLRRRDAARAPLPLPAAGRSPGRTMASGDRRSAGAAGAARSPADRRRPCHCAHPARNPLGAERSRLVTFLMLTSRSRRAAAAVLALTCACATSARAQGRPMALTSTRATTNDLRAWDRQIDLMVRDGDVRVREVVRDAMVPDRRHERLEQYVRGVRIFGAEVTRQTASDGVVSLFGLLHDQVPIDTNPRLTLEEARRAIASHGDVLGDAELVVLPLSDGYHLAYTGQTTTGLEILNVFVDANTGALLQKYSDFVSEVGVGKGTYGDDKKISARASAGTFTTDDPLRPGAITTYDMKGNLSRATAILNRLTTVAASDVGSDTDNVWTDPTVVDAHVYAGWYYDYLYKRFGRNGLDDRNLRMAVFTHPVRLQDIGSAPNSVVGLYYVNAFSCTTCGPDGRGAIVLGEGAPRNFFGPGIEVKSFAAALDVVAHELTHSVTGATARLNGFPYSEAGALNEAFSDMFGAATAFFYLPPGDGPMQASYMHNKDVSVPTGVLSRSLSSPRSTGDADHYTQRVIGGDSHYNGVIAGHAFYLAIEGGTNRTSGRTVQGVGAANRDQIEKAFFRALTVLLPPNATFGLTRVATIQAARDLYGAGSAAERAITQAWDAVGVQERTAPTAALLPNPAPGSTAFCVGSTPSWQLGITVSAGASTLQMNSWTLDLFDSAGQPTEHDVLTATDFGQFFNQCGPGSARVLAQADACSAICATLSGGRTSGAAQITFTATDASGATVTFATPRVSLLAPR
jgi:thermolysin